MLLCWENKCYFTSIHVGITSNKSHWLTSYYAIYRSDVSSSEDEKPKMEKLSLKKKGIGSEAKAERLENGDADLQLYNASERARQLHKLKKRRMQGNEDAVSCVK